MPSTLHSILSPTLTLTDARRRAGHDDVAGRELDDLGQFPDRLRHVPDHLIEVAVLLHDAVDLEHDAALGRMTDLRSRHQRTARRRSVERLADFPRPLHFARRDLQVAAGQIDADAVAPDAVIGLLGLDVQSAGFQRDHQLDFVMHVLGQRRVGHHCCHPARSHRRALRKRTAARARPGPSRGYVRCSCGRRTKFCAPGKICRSL